jgi:hypothetical protein
MRSMETQKDLFNANRAYHRHHQEKYALKITTDPLLVMAYSMINLYQCVEVFNAFSSPLQKRCLQKGLLHTLTKIQQ